MSRVVVLLIAMAVAGCKSPTEPDDITLGTPFELKAGASAELPDGLRLKFDHVSADSRCPIDVQCVSAGDATVVLLASNKGDNPVPIELHAFGAGSQISYSNHTIRLTGLQPFTRSDRQINALEYVATLIVNAP
jgi:hypothetical protein